MRKELYELKDCKPNSNRLDYKGQIIVMQPTILKEEFRKPEFQLWRANGGFGCDPIKIGRAVIATCIADGENARWDRFDFIGILKDELVEELNLKK